VTVANTDGSGTKVLSMTRRDWIVQ
jgi:hypothetical protein